MCLSNDMIPGTTDGVNKIRYYTIPSTPLVVSYTPSPGALRVENSEVCQRVYIYQSRLFSGHWEELKLCWPLIHGSVVIRTNGSDRSISSGIAAPPRINNAPRSQFVAVALSVELDEPVTLSC